MPRTKPLLKRPRRIPNIANHLKMLALPTVHQANITLNFHWTKKSTHAYLYVVHIFRIKHYFKHTFTLYAFFRNLYILKQDFYVDYILICTFCIVYFFHVAHIFIFNCFNFASYNVVAMSLTEVRALRRMVCGSILG